MTVLTTQHVPELPRLDTLNGVDVVRLPPIARLSRGALTPSFPTTVRELIRTHDAVHIHTPLLEAPLVAALARAKGRPLVMTHQGDLVMPPGVVNQTIESVGTVLLSVAGRLATVVCPLNADYARESRFLGQFTGKVVPILPPVDIPEPDQAAAARWRLELGLGDNRVVGFAGRFVREKGFDFLLRSIPELLARNPNARLLYAGEHEMVYEDFFSTCKPLLDQHRDRVDFVGLVHDRRRLATFYAMCDVLVLPSRTDSFAAVQVEAMLCGTPVVATDIPGARVPVQLSGMGVLVRPCDPSALAAGLSEVLADPARYAKPRRAIRSLFDPEESVGSYERLFTSLVGGCA